MFKTKPDIMQAVITELGLVAGTGVQLYTEPQIEEKIIDAFVTLADKRFWPHLTRNTTHERDGIEGVITDGLVGVRTVRDIEWIREYPYEKHNKIPFLHGEPFETMRHHIAYDAMGWDEELRDTKVVRFYPALDTTKVMIRARRLPTSFNVPDTVIPFDAICLQHFVTFLLLSTEGLNPGARDTQLGLFEQRYEDIIAAESNEPLTYGRRWTDSFTVEGT